MIDTIIENNNSLKYIKEIKQKISLTFLDPPFNQGKDYKCHDDNMTDDAYWEMMTSVCRDIYSVTDEGGALYFMQREKNAEFVLRAMRETKWVFHNLIIWKKFTSAAAPSKIRHSKHYQIIACGIKGSVPKTFNKLRIDPPRLEHHKYDRENGMYVTDLWDDIKELTSGYFSGEEVIFQDGEKFHKQQSPLALLVRIILTSSKVNDWVLDPFAGTGTTACVAKQLRRNSISIDIDPENVKCMKDRLNFRDIDIISKYKKDYFYTSELNEIWGNNLDANPGNFTKKLPKKKQKS
jgi:site-specific DNA-methyltransferase (adenine-specific)